MRTPGGCEQGNRVKELDGEQAGEEVVIPAGGLALEPQCNLARQPEMPAALEFLERAHRIERGAARALQTGLRPAEQRAAEGLTKTTLRRTWQRQRVVARLTEMTDRLGSLVQHQDTALEALSRLGPAVRDAAIRAMAVVQPALRQIAGPNARGGGRRQATARASRFCRGVSDQIVCHVLDGGEVGGA